MEGVAALTRIDEHQISVDVPADEAWDALLVDFALLTARHLWRTFARAIRCNPDRASGDPASVGATVPGFRVTRCLPPHEWALEGKHLFSRYALTFRIDPLDSHHCQVRAESSAVFPGHHGSAYRALVIGTGGHVIGVRGILRGIKLRAERSSVHP
jgi:hypothetical protein